MANGCYSNPYFPASFKGVPFEATELTTEVGRRVAKGEFPFSELTATADMGRRMRTYKVSARFVENSHVEDSNALLNVCELPGAGILIHPTHGSLFVICESASLRDDVLEEQGVSYLEMNLIEASDWSGGLQFGASLFGVVIDAIVFAAQTAFYASYVPNNVQFYLTSDVLITSAEAVGVVQDQFEKSSIGSRDQKIYSALNEMQTVKTDEGLLRDQQALWKTLSLGMAAIDKYATGDNKYRSFRTIANWAAKQSSLSGMAGTVQETVYTSVRLLAAAYMARSASETATPTVSGALGRHDDVLAILNQEYDIARENCNSALQLQIQSFAVQASKNLLYQAYQIPPTVNYNFSSGVHALVAAYEIYGDAKRARDIMTKNYNQLPFSMGPNVAAASV